MHYLLKMSSSANPDLKFWVSKLSKNSVLGVQMTRIGGLAPGGGGGGGGYMKYSFDFIHRLWNLKVGKCSFFHFQQEY